MRFEEWEPHYLRILEYFSFDRAQDEEAARVLSSLLTRDDCIVLEGLCRDRDVTVCGNAPNLRSELGGSAAASSPQMRPRWCSGRGVSCLAPYSPISTERTISLWR